MEVDFRAVLDEDFEFLFQMHRAVMRDYVVETWGEWNEDWQRNYYQRNFNPAHLQMIQSDGQDIGVLYIQERAEEIFIANLEILPGYQGRGVGTNVLQRLIEAARQRGKPVALQVLKANRRARGLYQRLGFGVTGESDHHYIMAYEHKRT